MATIILVILNLGFIVFGLWNITAELTKGFDLFNPKRRSLVSLRVILGGMLPLLIGVFSIYLAITDPFRDIH